MMFGRNNGSAGVAKLIPVDSVGVEIGVWKGETSKKFLKRAAHLHMVDPWTPSVYRESGEFGGYREYLKRYSELVGSDDPEDFQRYYDRIYENVVRAFKNEPVTIHRMTSREFFGSFFKRVDWVYIDGSHEYESVLGDLKGALRISDLVYGDDFNAKPGVGDAVRKFSKDRGLKYEELEGDQYRIDARML